jgi:hypothetical protein
MVRGNRLINTTILKEVFSFPETVNEYAARTVAGFVVALSILFLWTENLYILGLLAYGFWARVLTGPTLSPIALLVTKIIIPAVGEPRLDCPGPPKRFAQGIGAMFTTSSLILILSGHVEYANIAMSVLVFFASLESFIGFCAGCWMFKQMMSLGWIPETVCEKCNNLSFSTK